MGCVAMRCNDPLYREAPRNTEVRAGALRHDSLSSDSLYNDPLYADALRDDALCTDGGGAVAGKAP